MHIPITIYIYIHKQLFIYTCVYAVYNCIIICIYPLKTTYYNGVIDIVSGLFLLWYLYPDPREDPLVWGQVLLRVLYRNPPLRDLLFGSGGWEPLTLRAVYL